MGTRGIRIAKYSSDKTGKSLFHSLRMENIVGEVAEIPGDERKFYVSFCKPGDGFS